MIFFPAPCLLNWSVANKLTIVPLWLCMHLVIQSYWLFVVCKYTYPTFIKHAFHKIFVASIIRCFVGMNIFKKLLVGSWKYYRPLLPRPPQGRRRKVGTRRNRSRPLCDRELHFNFSQRNLRHRRSSSYRFTPESVMFFSFPFISSFFVPLWAS